MGDPRAKWYLERFQKLFRVEQLGQRFGRKEILRRRISLPIFHLMVDEAQKQAQVAPAKTPLGDAVRYLLDQQERLHRCLTELDAEISNNAVERVTPSRVTGRWMQSRDREGSVRRQLGVISRRSDFRSALARFHW